MQVLLPDFALLQPNLKGTPFKNSKKIINKKKNKTLQNNQNQRSKSSRTMTIQRTENVIANQNPSFYITQSFNTIVLESLPFKQKDNSSFFDCSQNPIHSRRTTKFIQGFMNKRKSYEKQFLQRNKLKLATNSPFLIAHSFRHTPKLQRAQQKDHYIERTQLISQIKNKFPRKKIKSAFKSQQYRPWSPIKNTQINDYIYQ